MAGSLNHSLMQPHSGVLVQLVFAFVILLQLLGGAELANVGVCYGMIANNLPPESEVIAMYKSNGITKMRLFFPTPQVFVALRDSGIDVILDVPRESLQSLATDTTAAAGWVRDNVLNNYPAVRFKYISVGNEIIPGDKSEFILPAMRNVRAALASAGVADQIKVSTVVHMVVIGNSFPPSAGVFSEPAMKYMRDIVSFLQSTNAPFMINVYPYFSYAGNPNQIAADYALFTANRDVFTDGNLRYQNLFDAMLDSVYAALEKVGAGGVDVIVTESGWPSVGSPQASVDNARTYNNNFVKYLKSGAGTPRRPGKQLEGYIFAMFNENQKDKNNPQGTENNFGLFFPNKQPVYPMQF